MIIVTIMKITFLFADLNTRSIIIVVSFCLGLQHKITTLSWTQNSNFKESNCNFIYLRNLKNLISKIFCYSSQYCGMDEPKLVPCPVQYYLIFIDLLIQYLHPFMFIYRRYKNERKSLFVNTIILKKKSFDI